MLRRFIVLLAVSLAVTSQSQADPNFPDLMTPPMTKYNDVSRAAQGTYYQLPNGNVLYGTLKPGRSGMPLKVLAAGLDDSSKNWTGLDNMLSALGYGVLTLDLRGQGNTLTRTADAGMNAFLLLAKRLGGDLSWQSQAEDIKQSIEFFGYKKADLIGLSYGGGIVLGVAELYPEVVNKVVAFAPYVGPIQSQLKQMQQIADALIFMFPFATPKQRLTYAGRFMAYTQDAPAEPQMLMRPDRLGVEAIIALGTGLAGFDVQTTINQFKTGKGSIAIIDGTIDLVEPTAMLDEAYKNAGDKALARMYIDWGLHRATTYDPLAALDIIRLIDSEKIKPGGYISYNPITRKFSPMKGAGNPVGFAGAPSCKEMFVK